VAGNFPTDSSNRNARVNKDNKTALLIDIAVPADAKVEEKEQVKMDRYQDLARELKRLWKVDTKVIPTGLSLNTAPAVLLRPPDECCRGSKTAPSTAPAEEAKH